MVESEKLGASFTAVKITLNVFVTVAAASPVMSVIVVLPLAFVTVVRATVRFVEFPETVTVTRFVFAEVTEFVTPLNGSSTSLTVKLTAF